MISTSEKPTTQPHDAPMLVMVGFESSGLDGLVVVCVLRVMGGPAPGW
jgi:hypothetical protein